MISPITRFLSRHNPWRKPMPAVDVLHRIAEDFRAHTTAKIPLGPKDANYLMDLCNETGTARQDQDPPDLLAFLSTAHKALEIYTRDYEPENHEGEKRHPILKPLNWNSRVRSFGKLLDNLRPGLESLHEKYLGPCDKDDFVMPKDALDTNHFRTDAGKAMHRALNRLRNH